jgi:hypothetical protein
MIRFIEKPCVDLSLSNVKIDQFFICTEGFLCQKVHNTAYITIATALGTPCAGMTSDVLPSMTIKKILPEIEWIEF